MVDKKIEVLSLRGVVTHVLCAVTDIILAKDIPLHSDEHKAMIGRAIRHLDDLDVVVISNQSEQTIFDDIQQLLSKHE